MLQACADMYDVKLEISMAGSAPATTDDPELASEIAALVKEKCQYDAIFEFADIGGSEDAGYFMERVQKNGGRASYLMYGTPIAAGHHNSHFDFNEEALWKAAATLTEMGIYYSNK